MPQMAPMSWLTLTIYFSSIFFLFNMVNFYMFLYSPSSKTKFKTSSTFNWKW